MGSGVGGWASRAKRTQGTRRIRRTRRTQCTLPTGAPGAPGTPEAPGPRSSRVRPRRHGVDASSAGRRAHPCLSSGGWAPAGKGQSLVRRITLAGVPTPSPYQDQRSTKPTQYQDQRSTKATQREATAVEATAVRIRKRCSTKTKCRITQQEPATSSHAPQPPHNRRHTQPPTAPHDTTPRHNHTARAPGPAAARPGHTDNGGHQWRPRNRHRPTRSNTILQRTAPQRQLAAPPTPPSSPWNPSSPWSFWCTVWVAQPPRTCSVIREFS